MRIAFIYDAAYPWITGGAEMRVYELAKRLSARGHDVHWYTMGWWWDKKNKKDIFQDGIKFHGVCEPRSLYSNERRSIKEALYFSLKLFRPLFKDHFDIIDCQGFPFFSCFIAYLHSILGKSNLFITWIEIWDDYWYEYLGKIGLFGKLIEKTTLKLQANWIAISEKVKRDLRKFNERKEIETVPIGIDLQEINQIQPSKDKSDVIFAGRLIKDKNVDLLIKSIGVTKDYLPNINCLIIGNGSEKKSLQRLVEDLDLNENIRFMNFFTEHKDLISYMKSSKLFVLPSTREGFGIVVLEANACGIPVIVVKGPMNAACDLIEDGVNGFTSDFSEEDMARKIIDSIRRKEEMRGGCLEMTNKFEWNKIIIKLEKYYNNSLSNKIS